jgi:peptidoglycan/LPS O-acetylase OafA/YrhL
MSHAPDPHLMTDIAPAPGRVPSLDGLRAVSIAVVLAHHFLSPLPGMPDIPGFIGVDMFFVISGFLITRLLIVEILATGHIDLPAFYARRALRLMPVLLACVLAISAFGMAIGSFDGRATVCALLYVTNYCASEGWANYSGNTAFLESTWSLAVEEHFYLGFPLILMALFRGNLRALYVIIGGLCGAALAFRIGYALIGKGEMHQVWRTETALDMLMAGCAISVMSAHAAGRRALRFLASARLLAIATVAWAVSLGGWSIGPIAIAPAQSVFALWLVVVVVNVLLNPELAGARALLNRPGMIWLGQISYSLYLWHALVAFVASYFGLAGSFAGSILCIALSFALAHASWICIERPILARREQWLRLLGLRGVSAQAPA